MRTRLTAAAIAAAALLALAACSSTDTAAPARYQQTWTKPYSDTTCLDYRTQMTQQQRWAMAADMLAGIRNSDGDHGLPSDPMITSFQRDMATACQADDTMKTTEIGAGVYALGANYHP